MSTPFIQFDFHLFENCKSYKTVISSLRLPNDTFHREKKKNEAKKREKKIWRREKKIEIEVTQIECD